MSLNPVLKNLLESVIVFNSLSAEDQEEVVAVAEEYLKNSSSILPENLYAVVKLEVIFQGNRLTASAQVGQEVNTQPASHQAFVMRSIIHNLQEEVLLHVYGIQNATPNAPVEFIPLSDDSSGL